MDIEKAGSKSMRLDRNFNQYREDIITYEISTQQSFSTHNAVIFFVFGMTFLLPELFLWKQFNVSTVLCLGVSALSALSYVLYKLVLPKHRNLVIPAGNVYIFIMVEFLLVIKQICGRNISWTLLLCSLIATSMVIIIPSYYIIVILLTLGPDMVEYMIVNKDRMNVLYNLVDDVIIAAFCIGINYIFSKIKYEEIKSKDTLYRKSSRDALTGLYNRSYFESYFDKYASWRKKCVIMTLNLDNFKMANDVYGHKKGDEVLCRVAEILKANFCDGDCVARLDGDEFAIFLPEVFKSEVVMERIEHVLKQFPIVIEGETDVEVSVSMGVVFKRAGEVPSYAKLCERADAAMFKAKKTGKAQAYVAS